MGWEPTQVEGTQGSLPQPEKDLESPSSMRLEALVTSHDSRVMTSSPSPCACGVAQSRTRLKRSAKARGFHTQLDEGPETP